MRKRLKQRLVFGFLTGIVVTGGIATAMGVYLIDHGIRREAQSKVNLDLNSARRIYPDPQMRGTAGRQSADGLRRAG